MRNLLYFIVVAIAALLQQSCATQKGTDGNASYPVKLADYADSQVVPYETARNWVENSGRWHDNDRYCRVHLNWQEYKKHPLTKAELKEKYDSASSVKKFLHSSNQQLGKNHKKVSKRLRSWSKNFEANDSVKVDVYRFANLSNDEEVQITLRFKVLERDEHYKLDSYSVEKAEMVYWTDDAKEHHKQLDLRNTTFDLYDYVNEFHFSTSFKYRGKWYYFFATDEHPAVCKPVE